MKKAIKRAVGGAKARVKKAAAKTKKRSGDVIGLSGSRVPSKPVPAGTKRRRRPLGHEVGTTRDTGLRPARVVGGVRGRGR
jgi:uncharacterized protein YggE